MMKSKISQWTARAAARAQIGLALIFAGYGGPDQSAKTPTEKPEWALNLTVDGVPVKFPMEVVDVYLVEDDAYAEAFEIQGQGVTLVGAFPLSIHVDYGDNWDVLKGQAITISSRVDNPRITSESFLDLPIKGRALVTDESFTVEKVPGVYPAPDGHLTLSGTIRLEVKTASGSSSLSGTCAVHAATWG